MFEYSDCDLCKTCVSKYTQCWSEWDDLMLEKENKHYCPAMKSTKNTFNKRPDNCLMSLEYIVKSGEA